MTINLSLKEGQTDYQSGGEARGEDDTLVLKIEFSFGYFSCFFEIDPWRPDRSSDLFYSLELINFPKNVSNIISELAVFFENDKTGRTSNNLNVIYSDGHIWLEYNLDLEVHAWVADYFMDIIAKERHGMPKDQLEMLKTYYPKT